MCKSKENTQLEGVKKRVVMRITPMLILAITIATILLVAPLSAETRIYVRIKQDTVDDVWVETVRVPFVSSLFPPSHKIGAYTINVTIQPGNINFMKAEVPSGEYVFVWSAVQQATEYTITVQLVRENLIVDIFVLKISF